MPQKVKLGTKGAGAYKGIAGFLNLKKTFDDAMRQAKWEKEKLVYAGRGAMERTMVGAGYRPEDTATLLAGGGGGQWRAPDLTPRDIGKGFVSIGGKPYRKPAAGDRTDVVLSKALTQARQLTKDWMGRVSKSKWRKTWPEIAKAYKLPKEYQDPGWALGKAKLMPEAGAGGDEELLGAIDQLQREILALQD